tara:strand:- start:2708 stop:3637 length:930 start_codon:yes stop_codon:yes gene_type:complete
MSFKNTLLILIIFLFAGCNQQNQINKDIKIKSDKNIKVKSDKDIIIKSDKDIIIKSDKEVIIKGDKDIKIKSDRDIIIKSDKDIKISYLRTYRNRGFALVYDDNLRENKEISKKIDSRSLSIFHKRIKKNSFVRITNPVNQKTVIAEVTSNNVEFSDFYNSVITSRIVEALSLDINEPYVYLVLIPENSTFIAKKAKTFDEEKNVAEKAPVDGIKIDNLGIVKKEKNVVKNSIFSYSIKIADFYFKDSATNMVKRIKNETSSKDSVIKKISKNKYRVLLGPFNDIKKLKESFNEIKSLNFENLEILKNV